MTKGIKAETGAFGTNPIEGLTQKQSDYLLSFVAKQQKKGTIDAVHGSTALRPQISEGLRKEAGVHLQLGDVDVVVKPKLTDAKIVLMDEPTAAISVRQVAEVLDYIRQLRDQGISIILISHRMPDVFEVSDRIVVLRRGSKVADKKITDSSPEEVTGLITGALQTA